MMLLVSMPLPNVLAQLTSPLGSSGKGGLSRDVARATATTLRQGQGQRG